MVRDHPHYRYHAFVKGIERLGYRATLDRSKTADVVILWNRNPHHEAIARRHELAGSTVIIAENGYIGREKMFALSLNFHNGAGITVDPLGSSERFDRLGIEVKPWRTTGQDILVLPQRGIGSHDVAMPKHWAMGALKKLKAVYPHVNIRTRPHPGGPTEGIPIEDDLNGVWAVATWGSSAAIKAMICGIPCFYDFRRWIGGEAAVYGVDSGGPLTDDYKRQCMLERVSYAQWSTDEIENGYAFERLLKCVR